MRVIDAAHVEKEEADFLRQMRSAVEPLLGQADEKARREFVASLDRLLDNRFYLLKDVSLDGLETAVPFVLVGPAGVHVIYQSNARGVFRAREDAWEELRGGRGSYEAARPNLMIQTRLMARALEAHLTSRGFSGVQVKPVVFLSNPGVHVETVRPVVRVVPPDALERFAMSLMQNEPDLDLENAQKVVNLIAGEALMREREVLIPEEDAFSFRDLPEDSPQAPRTRVVMETREPDAFKKVPFSRRQWAVLIGLILVNVILLTAFVLLILLSG